MPCPLLKISSLPVLELGGREVLVWEISQGTVVVGLGNDVEAGLGSLPVDSYFCECGQQLVSSYSETHLQSQFLHPGIPK